MRFLVSVTYVNDCLAVTVRKQVKTVKGYFDTNEIYVIDSLTVFSPRGATIEAFNTTARHAAYAMIFGGLPVELVLYPIMEF